MALNRLISRSREEVCDNFVLAESDPANYAQTLLDLAENCSRTGRSSPPLASLALLGTNWTLENRIAGLLKPGRETMTRSNRRAAVAIAILFGALCVLVGGIRDSDAQQGEDNVAQEAATDSAAADSALGALRKVVVRGECVNELAQARGGGARCCFAAKRRRQNANDLRRNAIR